MNIHDSGYKKFFSNQTIFRQLLETFVNQEWVNQIDFSTCETLDKSFISQHYQETESGLIYKVQLLNCEAVRTMLITALEKEKQQIYHNGHLEGKREGKIETAQAMLARGMGIALIAEITQLSQAQLLQLKAQLPVNEMLYQ